MPERAGWTDTVRRSAFVELFSETYRPPMAPDLPMHDLHFFVGHAGGRGPSSGYSMVVHPSRYAAKLQQRIAGLRARERQSEEQKRALAPRGQLESELRPRDLKGERDGLLPLAHCLEQVAVAAGANIVSDYHTKPPQMMESLEGLTLRGALDKVAATYRHYWNTTGQAFLFRSDCWWDDDAAEVPERLVRRWNAVLKDKGFLALDDMLEIAQLSDAQLGRLLLVVPDAEVAAQARAVLRFFARLGPTERAAAQSNQGLDCRSLPVPELVLLTQVMGGQAPYSSTHGNLAGPSALKDGVFTLSTSASPRQREWVFTVKRHHGDAWGCTLRQEVSRTESRTPGSHAPADDGGAQSRPQESTSSPSAAPASRTASD